MNITRVLIASILLICAAGMPAQADQNAQQVYKQLVASSLAVRSLSADFSEAVTGGGKTTRIAGRLTLLRPLYIRQDFWPANANGSLKKHSWNTPHEILASNGTTYWEIGPDGAMVKSPASNQNVGSDADAVASDMPIGQIASIFFSPSGSEKDQMPPHLRYAGTTRFDGLTCRKLADEEDAGNSGQLRLTILVGPDNLLRCLSINVTGQGSFVFELHNVRTGIMLTRADFAFKPPSWAKPAKTVAASSQEMNTSQTDLKMDAKSKELLATAAHTIQKIQSLSADYARTLTFTRAKSNKPRGSTLFSGSVMVMRPAYARITENVQSAKAGAKLDSGLSELHISDGTTYWNYYDAKKKLYESHSVASNGHDLRIYECELLSDFFTPDKSGYTSQASGWDKIDIRYAGVTTWLGRQYQTLTEHESATTQNETLDCVKTILIGQDGLIHRTIEHTSFSTGDRMTTDESISNLMINPSLQTADFAFTPPAGATEKAEYPFENQTQTALLANGAMAPDFTAYDRGGKPVHLSDYKGKVVVLDFWATWCGPCQMSLPNTNKVAQKYPDVVFLAVNVWDTQQAFNSWLPQHKAFSALKFAIDTTKEQGQDIASKLYHVDGIPTQFVIDASGKVVNSFVGYDPDTSGLVQAIKVASVPPAPAGATSATGESSPAGALPAATTTHH